MITASTLEDTIFEQEEILVVIRAPARTLCQPWPYQRKAPATMKVRDWLKTRLKPLLPQGTEAEIIDPSTMSINLSMSIETLRKKYERK